MMMTRPMRNMALSFHWRQGDRPPPSGDLLGQLSLAAFWLFLTVKVLESRKWK